MVREARKAATVLFLLSLFITATMGFAFAADLTIGQYQLVSSTRVGRTIWQYTYSASVTNNTAADAKGITATLATLVPQMTVESGTLTFGDVASGATVKSSNTFTIRLDRQYSLRESDLRIQIHMSVGVSVTLDEGNRVSSIITPEGGTIAATSADGTHYTLKIPSNAFLEQDPTTITMTPILSVTGFSSDQKYLAGVRLEPDGLLLLKPAILEIIKPAPLPTEDIFSIYINDPAGEYYANPLISVDNSNSTITFVIMHFSDWLAMTSTLCPAMPNPKFTADIYKNTIACLANKEMWDQIFPVLIAWFDEFILPSLEAANDIESLEPILLGSLEWRVYGQMFGFGENPQIQSRAWKIGIEVKRVLTAEFQRLNDQCNDTKDVCEKQNIYTT